MSVLKMMFAKHAPTHHAEKYWPSHDKTLNIVEARRGRGKSFGAVRIMVEWLKERWAAILSGAAPYARILSNIRFELHRVALVLCREGVANSLDQALDVLRARVVYLTTWDQLLQAFDSLVLLDEANRNLNVYDSSKPAQALMLMVHDWLQQTRKHLLTLWFFVQDVSWLKGQLLSLCDRLWRAKRVRIKGTPRVKYFPWYGSDPFSKGKDGPLNRAADFKMRFDFCLWTARCYDTFQAVQTLPAETQFKSFGELSDYMLAHDLKPAELPGFQEGMSWSQLQEWFDAPPPGPVWGEARLTVSPPVSPLRDDGGRGGAHVPPPTDMSNLPVSFPRHLL